MATDLTDEVMTNFRNVLRDRGDPFGFNSDFPGNLQNFIDENFSHHDFNNNIVMGLNIYSWPNSYPRQSHEYILLRTIRSPNTVNLHHKEYPRLFPDNPRNRTLDSNAMVLPSLTP